MARPTNPINNRIVPNLDMVAPQNGIKYGLSFSRHSSLKSSVFFCMRLRSALRSSKKSLVRTPARMSVSLKSGFLCADSPCSVWWLAQRQIPASKL